MVDEPIPVVCPAPSEPADGDDPLEALLARLADPTPLSGPVTFPRGTLQPDGRLDLCKQSLGGPEVRRVVDAAVRSSHARHLLLGTNSLGAAGVAVLAEALGDGHQVQTLYLGCNHVDADGVAPLARRLAGDRSVKALWLKRNPIGDAGARLLAAALADNASVRTLDLTNTGLTAAGLHDVVDSLTGRSVQTERIYLGGNNFGPEVADSLARLLREAGVSELYLNAGRLGDAGAAAIVEALPVDRRVVLGLGGNGIGPDGVRTLAARLGRLSTLDLARPPSSLALRAVPNHVGDEGAAALAEALPGSGLRRLDLRHTGVTGRGARRLVQAVEASTDLELLGLGAGVPRRLKRAVGAVLRPSTDPAPDILAIASVYR